MSGWNEFDIDAVPFNKEIVLCMKGGSLRVGEIILQPSANMIFGDGEEGYFPVVRYRDSGGTRVENVKYWIEKP